MFFPPVQPVILLWKVDVYTNIPPIWLCLCLHIFIILGPKLYDLYWGEIIIVFSGENKNKKTFPVLLLGSRQDLTHSFWMAYFNLFFFLV